MTPRLSITKDDTAKVIKVLRGLTQNQCLVGIPSATAERQPDADDPHPLNNAEIGYIQDKGSPAANIPARPFLEPGIESVQDQISKRYADGAKAAMDGKVANIDAVHEAVGLIADSAVKAKITTGPFQPLADSTLANRRRRGRTGESPLIDTGQLRQAITHVIRPKG